MSKSFLTAIFLAALSLGGARADDLVKLKVGIANSASDVGLLVAQKKGYFKREGLDVDLIPFQNAAVMIAPFATGELDAGGGGPSAALYNAVARGIDVRIVADKTSTPVGRPLNFLLVRKDLVDSGRFKTIKDLKGMKVASGAVGGSATAPLDKLFEKAGLSPSDVERVAMDFPQVPIALANKAVDASMLTEPSASAAVRNGSSVKIMGDDVIYPGHQVAVILYGGPFIHNKPKAAQSFMRAYLEGVRDYNDAIVDGKLAGPKGEAIISILTEMTPIKDPNVYRTITAVNIDPDGKLDVPSLQEDIDIFTKQGLIQGQVDLKKVVDTSFTDEAVKALGAYKKAEK